MSTPINGKPFGLDLHDATLVSVAAQLEGNTVSLQVRTADGSVTLDFVGLVELSLGREMPWGPSASINSASLRDINDDLVEFSAELQGGDMPRVRARRAARS